MLFNKTEVKHLVISALVLGFVFGFDDGKPLFVFSYWILNYLKFVVLSFIVLIIQELGQKLIAARSGCITEHRIWKIKRYGFARHREFIKLPFGIENLYLGIIIPILLTILSSGQLKFAAVGLSLITINPAYRLGRKYAHLTDFETAKIALTGPLIAMLFALILKIFPVNSIAANLIVISTAFALSNIIPLPRLDGFETFFGSKPLFVFGAAFLIGCYYLIIYMNLFTTLILSLIMAAILVVLYYYYIEFT